MSTIIVNGLPKEIRRPKLVLFLKSAFRKHFNRRQEFWVSACNDVPGSMYKEVSVSFHNIYDALAASEVLNNLDYIGKSDTYKLSVYVDNDNDESRNTSKASPARVRSPIQHANTSNNRRFTQSPPIPGQGSVAFESDHDLPYTRNGPINREIRDRQSQIDLELELLQKQQLLIEEERRLLLEKKKLELIQERACSLNDRAFDRKESRPTLPERTETRPKTKPKEKDLTGRPFYKKFNDSIPRFVMPCKFLIKDMRRYITKYSEKKTRKALEKRICLEIRSRIAVAIKDQRKVLLSKEIFNLYRKNYPKGTDETLVKSVANDIKSHVNNNLSSRDDRKNSANGQNWFVDTVGDGDPDVNETEDWDLNDNFGPYNPRESEDWDLNDNFGPYNPSESEDGDILDDNDTQNFDDDAF